MNPLRKLSSWLGMQPGEERVGFALFLYLFGVITCYLMLKPARDGLFISQYGSENLPVVMIATSLAAALTVSAYLYLLRHFTLVGLTYLTLGFFRPMFSFFGNYRTIASNGSILPFMFGREYSESLLPCRFGRWRIVF